MYPHSRERSGTSCRLPHRDGDGDPSAVRLIRRRRADKASSWSVKLSDVDDVASISSSAKRRGVIALRRRLLFVPPARPTSASTSGPSRLWMRHLTCVLYVSMELVAERTARATHGYHMNSIRWGSQRRCRECASAGEVWRRRPHFFTVNTPATTPHTLMTNGTDRRAHPGPCGLDGRFRHFPNLRRPGRG